MFFIVNETTYLYITATLILTLILVILVLQWYNSWFKKNEMMNECYEKWPKIDAKVIQTKKVKDFYFRKAFVRGAASFAINHACTIARELLFEFRITSKKEHNVTEIMAVEFRISSPPRCCPLHLLHRNIIVIQLKEHSSFCFSLSLLFVKEQHIALCFFCFLL